MLVVPWHDFGPNLQEHLFFRAGTKNFDYDCRANFYILNESIQQRKRPLAYRQTID